MPITNKTIIDRINSKISDPETPVDDINKLTTISGLLTTAAVYAVDTIYNLPPASLNDGRLIFVKSVSSYRYSNGITWAPIESSIPKPTAQIWVWGNNGFGQLGDNTSVNRSSPVSVVGGFTDWCQVSAGYRHNAAIRTNGTLWTWGMNSSPAADAGQLGDGTVVSRSSPVSIVGGFTDWCQVSAGYRHTAAIRTNGTLWTWGGNGYGQIGDNTIVNKSSPVSVVGGFTDWCQVSAGKSFTTAIRTNGTLWTWGINTCGQLGIDLMGIGTCKSSPVSVVGGFTDWCQVSAGDAHAAAIRTNGTLWSWGCNNAGQLGNGDANSKQGIPCLVLGGFTDWCQVSAGDLHTAAIRTNGTLWTWGNNGYGQLGDNTVVNKSSPVSVIGGFTDWGQVSTNKYQTAAVRTNGTLWSWGVNVYGILGDATTVSKSSPVSVVGGFTGWGQTSSGNLNGVGIVFTG